MFVVFQPMLNLYLLFVNVTSFLIRLLVDFSFGSENGGCRIISFCSSDNHSEITKSYLSLLKYSAVFLIKFLGTPADKNAFVMLFTSKLNLLAILLAQCNSPVIGLCLYLVKNSEVQCTRTFFNLL